MTEHVVVIVLCDPTNLILPWNLDARQNSLSTESDGEIYSIHCEPLEMTFCRLPFVPVRVIPYADISSARDACREGCGCAQGYGPASMSMLGNRDLRRLIYTLHNFVVSCYDDNINPHQYGCICSVCKGKPDTLNKDRQNVSSLLHSLSG